MIKTQVTTLTRFPIRRADLNVGIASREDIEKVKKILADAAEKILLCLSEPVPLFILHGFGTSSVDIQFSVWAKRENSLLLKNSIYQEIKAAFDKNGPKIPFPHQSLYSGEASKSINAAVSSSDKEQKMLNPARLCRPCK
jgi:small-conductance mechanosensitive channel